MNLSEQFTEKEIKRMEKIPFYRDVGLWIVFLCTSYIIVSSFYLLSKAYQYADTSGFLDYLFKGSDSPSNKDPYHLCFFLSYFSAGILFFLSSICGIIFMIFYRKDSLKWKSYRLILSMIEKEKEKDVTN